LVQRLCGSSLLPGKSRTPLGAAAAKLDKERKDTDVQIRCLSILRHLQLDPVSTPFWTPRSKGVNTNVWKDPTDLSTIAAQLGSRLVDPALFAREVELVWTNYEMYGPITKRAALKIAAAGCKAAFNRLFHDWVKASDRPEDPNLFVCQSCTVAK
jgi:hypothetical protein